MLQIQSFSDSNAKSSSAQSTQNNLKVLGFDIGIASIGWAYVEGGELKDCGVRIFTKAENPKDGSSLALPRREARGARRRLARRKARLYALKDLVCKEFGLNLNDFLSPAGELPEKYHIQKCQIPKDERKQMRKTKEGREKLEKLDVNPYRLRTKALEDKLTPDEFARVILHIAKHRGYGNKHAKESSDEKDKKKKSEQDGIKGGIAKNKGYKENYETIGAYLYNEFYGKARSAEQIQAKIEALKADYKKEKIKPEKWDKNKLEKQSPNQQNNVRNKFKNYERCLKQDWLKEELEIIFTKQREFGFDFSETKYKIYDENRDIKELDFESAILQTAFLQRPLKSFADKVGKCTFFADEPRAPKDSLSAMEFVALGQIINTLRYLEKESLKKEYGEVYGKEKINEILQIVLTSGKISYARLRKILALPSNIYFPKGKNLDYTKGNISTQIKSFLYKISKKVSPKEKNCIYTKDQEMQIYDIVRENGGISYAKLRQILNLSTNIKFDNTLLGKGKGLDYAKENIEETIREIKEKDPESSAFLNFENLVKFRNAFEPKKKNDKTNESIDDGEDLEENDDTESSNGVFATLAQNHRDELDKIATDIAQIKSKDGITTKLKEYPNLNNAQIENLSELNFSKYINLSFKALDKILPYMREGMLYDKAVELAQSEVQNPLPKPKEKEKHNSLPSLKDYEPYLANPVVARALSEYRKVCNALLEKYGTKENENDKYGKVHKIHIELSREVGKSYLTRKQYEKEQDENLKKINEAKERLKQYEIPINAQNVLKARLFIEQGEYCAYSKAKITREHLCDPKALEIDHIYPYSRSFDDSYNNKVLVFAKENQHKRNQTPFEAFGKDKQKWEMIKSFAKNFLPHKKYKRVVNENFADKENEFKDRNLNDTKYMARLALNYTKDNLSFEKLSENECTISGEKGSKIHCEAVSGTLTTNLRRIWEFENKSRDNHLHHALDAIIIAHINASMVKRFSEYYKRKNELKITHHKKRDKLKWQLHNNEISQDEYDKQDEETTKAYNKEKELNNKWIKEKFCLPYEDFHKVVEEKINKIFVSKPPRKRARGALHEETFKSVNDEKLLKMYGGKEGVNLAIKLGKIRQIGSKVADNGTMVRVDIFRHKLSGKFYGVPIYTMDFALGVLPNKAVVGGKDKSGVIKDWLEMDSSYKFCFSLFKDDLILVKKKEMSKAELCYFVSFGIATASISVEKHDNHFGSLSENQKLLFTNATPQEVKGLSIGIQNLKVFEKWQVSPLGKTDFKASAEKPEIRQNISLKSTPKRF
ncbi:type II CRISPR RNA-guided endonuclease Cas9 [Helicobacter sp. T3_23-1056]